MVDFHEVGGKPICDPKIVGPHRKQHERTQPSQLFALTLPQASFRAKLPRPLSREGVAGTGLTLVSALVLNYVPIASNLENSLGRS